MLPYEIRPIAEWWWKASLSYPLSLRYALGHFIYTICLKFFFFFFFFFQNLKSQTGPPVKTCHYPGSLVFPVGCPAG
jgi:hypothetical protein